MKEATSSFGDGNAYVRQNRKPGGAADNVDGKIRRKAIGRNAGENEEGTSGFGGG
ncbi:MAG: hypothetical protein LBE16_06335 [Clostridiales Family XIII bacterium]|jgi:hypothetical protein|nr:hypothetical protein [Clostridiales Family XIII bacterium]